MLPSSRAGLVLTTFTAIKRSPSATIIKRVAEAVADAILSHSQSATRGGVLGVYQRAVRAPEQIAAMTVWGRLLEAAIHGKENSGNVIPLRAAADDQVAAA